MIRADEVREVAGARQRLPDRRGATAARTPERVARALRPPHSASAPTACSCSRPPDEPGFVARLRIFNPDGSEAELSGNGAREAILYLRRAAGRDAPTSSRSRRWPARSARRSLDERTCRVDMGRATTGAARARSRAGASSTSSIGNPQCAIRVDDRDELEALDLPAIGPPIEHDPRFPNRTNVSFWTELAPDRIRARIFERGVGETMSTRHRRERRGDRPRPARRRLAGHRRARRRRADRRRRRGPPRRPRPAGPVPVFAASSA